MVMLMAGVAMVIIVPVFLRNHIFGYAQFYVLGLSLITGHCQQ